MSTNDDVVIVFNNLRSLAEQVKAIGAEAVVDSVERIEADVRQRWPNRRRIPLKKRYSTKNGRILGEVVAGNRRKFTGIFDEYGTQFRAAKPAMTPAAEAERPKFMKAVADLESKLRG